MPRKPDEAKPEEELFEIELQGILREFEPTFGSEDFHVTFNCNRAGQNVEVTIEIDIETVTTLEIVPRAMAELHKVFAALAEQSKAWTGGQG